MFTDYEDPVPDGVDPVEWVRQMQAESDRRSADLSRYVDDQIAEADEENRQRHARNAELEKQMWDIVHDMRAQNEARGF